MTTRRGRNEGSIYQRADGRSVGMASFMDGGRRRRRAVYGVTKREAQDKLKAIRRAVDDGMGGFKPYTTPKLPAGPTGISVGAGMGGFMPYNPLPKPPAGPTGISVGNGMGARMPYIPR